MPVEHKVKQGECISSIAAKYGFFPETIWNDSANADLKNKRKNPNVLFPGDIVTMPDKKEKEESGETEKRHYFRRKGIPEVLRLRLMDDIEPLANESYSLQIDGKLFSGSTDNNGRLAHPIPPGAKKGKLIVGMGENEKVYNLQLGDLDPETESSGIQGRLRNLGYNLKDSEEGKMDSVTIEAIKSFQKRAGLEITGKADNETRNKLKEMHGY